jgi:hypothetical protein
MLTTHGSLPQQRGVVWNLLLEADPKGRPSSFMQLLTKLVVKSWIYLQHWPCAYGALSAKSK